MEISQKFVAFSEYMNFKVKILKDPFLILLDLVYFAKSLANPTDGRIRGLEYCLGIPNSK